MKQETEALPEPPNTTQDTELPTTNTNGDEYTATNETYDDHITTLMYNAIDVYKSSTEPKNENRFKKATCTVITHSAWLQTPIKAIDASQTDPDNPEYTQPWSEITPDNTDWNTAIKEAAHICIFNDVMRKLHN